MAVQKFKGEIEALGGGVLSDHLKSSELRKTGGVEEISVLSKKKCGRKFAPGDLDQKVQEYLHACCSRYCESR